MLEKILEQITQVNTEKKDIVFKVPMDFGNYQIAVSVSNN